MLTKEIEGGFNCLGESTEKIQKLFSSNNKRS